MYIVFITSSIPTLRPFVRQFASRANRVSKLSYNSRRRHATRLTGGDDGTTTLTSSSVPPGRTKAYAGAADDDSTEETASWMGRSGQILMTTRIDVSSRNEGLGKV